MLSVLCVRPRRWLLASVFLSYNHASFAAPSDRLLRTPIQPFLDASGDRRQFSIDCAAKCSGSASIWHTILPSFWRQQRRRTAVFDRFENEALKRGEGSWNVAWDARPARWLHHPDSAWAFFGVCGCLATPLNHDVESTDANEIDSVASNQPGHCDYRVTGVVADGRCLFRAIAHMSCLRNGENIPDENRQTQLADELRAQVVEELLKRRTEVQWFIEEDFDAYVKRIQQPYVWGGEPELLMSSHVLRKPISVFMKKKNTGGLIEIANYGEEYRKNEENPINVLFHGYGHYDILEAISDSSLNRES